GSRQHQGRRDILRSRPVAGDNDTGAVAPVRQQAPQVSFAVAQRDHRIAVAGLLFKRYDDSLTLEGEGAEPRRPDSVQGDLAQLIQVESLSRLGERQHVRAAPGAYLAK